MVQSMTRLSALLFACLVLTAPHARAATSLAASSGLSALVAPADTGRGLRVFGVSALLAIAVEALRSGKARSSQSRR